MERAIAEKYPEMVFTVEADFLAPFFRVVSPNHSFEWAAANRRGAFAHCRSRGRLAHAPALGRGSWRSGGRLAATLRGKSMAVASMPK